MSPASSAAVAAAPLSDRFEPVACPLCRADDWTPEIELDEDFEYRGILDDALTLGRFRIVRCRRCSLVYLNPRPSLEQVLRYYPDEYCCFEELPPKSRLIGLFYRVLVRLEARELLPGLPPDGVLLDFGCGTGHWLVALRPFAAPGQRLVGIDASERAIARLRGAGVEAHVGDDSVLERVLGPESVDRIYLNHVIEHVPDPVETLRRLAGVLKPGGRIHGATPNIDAWDRRLFGRDWVGGWHVPRHFVHLERATLARLVSEAGFELVSVASSLEAASHWAMALQTRLARRSGWRPRPGQLRMRGYPLILGLAMGVTALQLATSRTSVMTFVLSRPD